MLQCTTLMKISACRKSLKLIISGQLAFFPGLATISVRDNQLQSKGTLDRKFPESIMSTCPCLIQKCPSLMWHKIVA